MQELWIYVPIFFMVTGLITRVKSQHNQSDDMPGLMRKQEIYIEGPVRISYWEDQRGCNIKLAKQHFIDLQTLSQDIRFTFLANILHDGMMTRQNKYTYYLWAVASGVADGTRTWDTKDGKMRGREVWDRTTDIDKSEKGKSINILLVCMLIPTRNHWSRKGAE